MEAWVCKPLPRAWSSGMCLDRWTGLMFLICLRPSPLTPPTARLACVCCVTSLPQRASASGRQHWSRVEGCSTGRGCLFSGLPFHCGAPVWLLVITQLLSRVRLFVTPWTIAHQAPLSMGFSRQEYWSGLPFPPPGDLPDSGIEPACLLSPALAGGFFTMVPAMALAI